jgi:hypothetical protein
VADRVTLTLPADEGFEQVVHLVVGGLAVRLDLTIEHLEDMLVALDALLDRMSGGERASIGVTVDGRRLRASVGPFADGALDDLELEDGALGLRRVLETVCDSFEVEERGAAVWVELSKAVRS